MEKLDKLQNIIGYTFKNKALLRNALTHSSFLNECKDQSRKSNERLEFLGDAVLGLVIAQYLFETNPGVHEGILTKARAATVCENTLAQIADEISLSDYIIMGKGEMKSGGNKRKSSLSDATEAIMAAIYLDGGLEKAREFILKYFSKLADSAVSGKAISVDYKTKLQEWVQKDNGSFEYRLASEKGPDHDKEFSVELFVNDKLISSGVGNSKTQAEQNAAKKALEILGE